MANGACIRFKEQEEEENKVTAYRLEPICYTCEYSEWAGEKLYCSYREVMVPINGTCDLHKPIKES
jgi:hypothetical protein